MDAAFGARVGLFFLSLQDEEKPCIDWMRKVQGQKRRTGVSAPHRPGQARSQQLPLWHSPHYAGQHFSHVVIDHHHREQHQKHECGLVNPFFDPQADVPADKALHK